MQKVFVMGGFEGGDEGGFWDTDTLAALVEKQNEKRSKSATATKSHIETSDSGYRIKAHAKINIFFKITGYQDGRPTLLSRCVRVDELYDTISFVPCECEAFTIEGCDTVPLESNTIYKAYKALCSYTADPDIAEFFHEHKVVVTKGIPYSAGLAGASSDAASFMHLLKEVCNLVISSDELAKIGSSVAADVPFFIYNYSSANVSGCGEIVEAFEEEALKMELYTPDLEWDTALICETVEKQLSADIALSTFADWQRLDSRSILKLASDPVLLNDLYYAARLAFPDLKKEARENWYSSGWTFFKLID